MDIAINISTACIKSVVMHQCNRLFFMRFINVCPDSPTQLMDSNRRPSVSEVGFKCTLNNRLFELNVAFLIVCTSKCQSQVAI